MMNNMMGLLDTLPQAQAGQAVSMQPGGAAAPDYGQLLASALRDYKRPEQDQQQYQDRVRPVGGMMQGVDPQMLGTALRSF